MATYTKASNSIPAQQRAVLITDVGAGDRIDIQDVLARGARQVIFKMTDATDTISYKINHLRRVRPSRTKEEKLTVADQVYGVFEKTTVEFWSGSGDTFTATGSSQLEIADGLEVSSLEIVSLSLSSGSTISIEVT